jgi:hypothetical protein
MFLFNKPTMTREQLVDAFLGRMHAQPPEKLKYSDYDVTRAIIPAYYDRCVEVGLDPVVVVAQLSHETGWLTSDWCARPFRNPSGIGVTGAWKFLKPTTGSWQKLGFVWREGCAFDTWVDNAIPAHIGRLLAYALTDAQATTLQRTYITRALQVRPLPLKYRGVAVVTMDLNGRWAYPGTFYGQKIEAIAKGLYL